jgi:hypothetical protein
MWPSLPSSENHRFQQEISPWFSRLISAMPLRNALIVQNLFDRGQLRMVGGDEIYGLARGHSHILINTTDMSSAKDDPLLARMADGALLQFNSWGGIAIDPTNHRVHDELPIYANGAITQGEVFTANSLYSSAHGAEGIAQDLCRMSLLMPSDTKVYA